MNKALAFFLVLIPLVLLFSLSWDTGEEPQNIDETVEARFSSTDVSVTLEVADGPEEREKGLMYRRQMADDRGMLFVYPREGDRSFWMKNTYMPLDIIFLNGTKHVINVETAQPEPDTSEQDLKRYRSDEPARYVIELNAGFAENHSVKSGSKVSWSR